jgi:hypothetical protein
MMIEFTEALDREARHVSASPDAFGSMVSRGGRRGLDDRSSPS